jgi:hypothetical protein
MAALFFLEFSQPEGCAYLSDRESSGQPPFEERGVRGNIYFCRGLIHQARRRAQLIAPLLEEKYLLIKNI